MPTENRHITRIETTEALFRANGDHGQSAILTDVNEEWVYWNDNKTKLYYMANQYYWNGAAIVYCDVEFSEIEAHSDILIDEYIKRSAGTDDNIRFKNDKITIAAGGVDAFIFEDDRVYTALKVGINNVAPAYELDVTGAIGVDDYIHHNGDANTHIYFSTDRIQDYVGGKWLLDMNTVAAQDYVKLGDGTDVDINLNDNVFVDGATKLVGIGCIPDTAKLNILDGSFYLRNTSVGHGMTTIVPANVFGYFDVHTAPNGGLIVGGLSDSGGQPALWLSGWIGSTDPTDTVPAVIIRGGKDDGALGLAALAASETVLQLRNFATPLMTILGNGNTGFSVLPQTWNADRNAIQIGAYGAIYSMVTTAAGGHVALSHNFYYDGASKTMNPNSDESCRLQLIEGDFRFLNSVAQVAGAVTQVEKMRLTLAGYLGVGISAPDCKLHAWMASCGAQTADASAAICVENDNDVSFQFLSPNNKKNKILFGDVDNPTAQRIEYDHLTANMDFLCGGNTLLRLHGVRFNIGLATETFDGDVQRYLAIANGTQPGAHTDDQIYIGSKDSTFNTAQGHNDGATMALFLETNLIAHAMTPTHAVPVWVNGTEIFLLGCIPV